mmetsp:Transcript_69965/g.109448  ORF Transcript_69965/g.109448 Transcript_69965/m.109448 type:complete len:491 (+) Transcript_69965:81-1553(+)
MRHLLKKQQASRDSSPDDLHDVVASTPEPFGSWTQADLESLPRFPHRDSLPAAKGFINQFLQGGLDYQDLRITLFWLGFGLLDVPTAEEPTMSLVPLCKDLDTYVEIATELGYDPTASVHLRPTCRIAALEEQARTHMGNATSSASSHSNSSFAGSAGSSSSATLLADAQVSMAFRPPPRRDDGELATPGTCNGDIIESCVPTLDTALEGHVCRVPLRRGQRSRRSTRDNAAIFREGQGTTMSRISELSEGSSCQRGHEREDLEASRELSERARRLPAASAEERFARWRARPTQRKHQQQKEAELPPCYYLDYCEEENQEGIRQSESSAYYEDVRIDEVEDLQRPAGSSASSQGLVWGVRSEELEVSYKVKLLYAGGWSSSSSSEGNRTPPTPPLPSSSSTGLLAALQAGGLDADHVEQFTVTFISDVEMHEDFGEISSLCTFCLDDMKVGEELCRLPCMHTFHKRCVHAWLERDRRCMLCRLDITRPRG